MNKPIDDVWCLEDDDQEFYCDILSQMIQDTIDGKHNFKDYLRSLWDNEEWESIVSKIETEGSNWYVWWIDGINAFIHDQNKKEVARL